MENGPTDLAWVRQFLGLKCVLVSLKIRYLKSATKVRAMANGLSAVTAKEESAKEESAQEKILAAIRRAAAELGRAPSRGELRRITGLSHYKVLAEFPSLREAVRAAGLEPNPKGERIETDALLEDWKRVGEKLGRRPSRAEYVREGRYSAGAFVARFGSWAKIHHGDNHPTKPKSGLSGTPGTETRRTAKKRSGDPVIGKSGDRKTGTANANAEGKKRQTVAKSSTGDEKAIAFQWGERLAPLLPPLVGKRRVTEMVASLVVNTLLGGSWPFNKNHFTTEGTEEHGGGRDWNKEDDQDISLAVHASRGIDKDRAVMGPPLEWLPMTNAPMNELGVVFLFGMVAAGLGFQVESLQGKFPDCEAKREVVKGKWERSRIEFEYESKNFHLHGHDPKGCDVIVCWRHNWKACPEELEVIELCRVIGRSGHRLIG
jgi:Homing endonuclease associated repeat